MSKGIGNKSTTNRKHRPPLTPQARENQMISLAIDAAEQQLQNGTASSQVLTHFLKLGSSREQREQEILDKQLALIEAKTESLQSIKAMDDLYNNALAAMKNYSGNGDNDTTDY